MKLSTIFAFAVIYCGSVEAANLRRFLEDIDSGSSDFLGDSSDSSAAERSLQEFDTSIDGSSVLDSNGEPSNSGFIDMSEDGSTFRLLEEEGLSVNGLDEPNSDSEGGVDSSYQPGTVKPASFDASGSFDESGVLWWNSDEISAARSQSTPPPRKFAASEVMNGPNSKNPHLTIDHFQFLHGPETPPSPPQTTMTKLNVILSFAAVALAITTYDGANATSLRSNDRFLASFDASTSDSTDGERFLTEDSVEGDNSESFDGERFLVEMEGSEVDEGSESTDGVRFLQEVDSSEGSTDDEGGDSLEGERFLQEASVDTEGSDSLSGDRFLQEESAEGSESVDGDRFLEEAVGSDIDSSESTDGDRFLQEVEGSESSDDDSSVEGDRFLAEVEGSESGEGSESESA